MKLDKDVNFYTGISKMSTFTKMHDFISKYVRQLWIGPKLTASAIKRKFNKIPNRMGPARKLNSYDQFLLTFIKLRLNVPFYDLARRFKVSESTCLRIFATWTRAAANILKSFVFIPDQGILNLTKPSRFSCFKNLNSIIDCSEVFIQTPKDPKMKRMTWSSYKHHNTLKILIAVSPNSMIVFVSKAFPGSISDKAITNQSGFLNLLDPYTTLMADKGFKIDEECAAKSISVIIPPGKLGHSQMLPQQIIKTKEIAKNRILVEQVIRRLKCFRILSQELPITLLPHIDDIIIICSALTNFKRPIFK